MIRFGKIAICPPRLAWGVFFLVLLSASCCYSADVVFIRVSGGSSTEQQQLEIAANFYGLNLKVITAGSAGDDAAIKNFVNQEETVGVAISANALAAVNRDALIQALHRKRGSSAPLLIVGVGPDSDPILLKSWSGDTALGCKRLEKPATSQYVFGRVDGVTLQLAGLETPIAAKEVFYLVPGENSAAQPIISSRHDNQVSPVFIQTMVQQQKVFVSCATFPGESLTNADGVADAFLRIAPAMMFIGHSAGELGWHAPHQYANLTIDDPWLRQPYGYVDYQGLLGEMQKHGFHTTIAFIPWNYDRSEPGVVSLIRNHPERFSISVHGDNHDHKEFTDYRSKSLPVQVADLQQSLARMEQFRSLTGIPYDNVMIFPHSIAPEKTLEALKTYNYLATVNSTNVPQDRAAEPSSLSSQLRVVTLSYAGFPSLRRYSVDSEVPKSLIAINEFLGNPLLFYGHSDSFSKGVDSFDGVADGVNQLEPNTQWRGLGDIAKHLYVVKLRDDSNYDVLAFSSNVCLDNTSGRDPIFYVRKQEIGPQTIVSVNVDGQHDPYRVQDGYLSFSVPVAAGKTRCAVIEYRNDLELASIATSKNSFIIFLLRRASDFRDIYLSKSAVGLAFIHFYNEHELKPVQVPSCALVLMGICIFAGYRLSVFVNRRHPASKAPGVDDIRTRSNEQLGLPPAGTSGPIR